MAKLTANQINELTKALANKGLANEIAEQLELAESAINGDILLEITPAAVDRDATTSAWARTVEIKAKNSNGTLHKWLNQAFTTTLSIGDTSALGTASIVSTTLTFVNGVARVVVSGDAAAWVAAEANTLTVADITLLGYTVTGGTSVETIV